jgi:hypothetical protein
MFKILGTVVFGVCLAASISAGQDNLADATADAAPQIASLNHFFVIVDDETAEAIKTSAFLRQFLNLSRQNSLGCAG